MRNIKTFIQDFGWPRIIIFLFLVGLFIMAPFVQVRLDASISDVLNRFGTLNAPVQNRKLRNFPEAISRRSAWQRLLQSSLSSYLYRSRHEE